ncbi:peptidoglycan DD-metalloendopeptidase family protein [Virgibacillus flavescens]|uniref:peptidoglycan DD-metalloendopeptidase family protein n=1 Tax=Virgibacillus flavescens TaxID=1611422 RepID=UPI003D334631
MFTNHTYLSNLKKIIFLVILAIGLSFTSTVSAASSDLGVVYHVYLDGKHIGKVNDKAVVQEILDKKTASGEKQFENMNITVGENISFVSEKVFNPTYDNLKVAGIVKSGTSIKAKAVELSIAGNTVGYFKDKKTVEQVIKAYKAKYVSEDVLDNLKKQDAKPVLSVDESAITEVALSEEVKLADRKISPEDVRTVKQGVKLLEKGTLEEKKHKVSKGEVLVEIARQYDLSKEKLFELNPSIQEDSVLSIGDELNVTEYAPFVNVIVKKKKLVEETIEHKTKVIESDDLYKGEDKVKQEGKDGKQEVQYAIEMINGKETGKKVIEETVIQEPVKNIIIKGTKVISSRGTGDLHWPAIGGYVSSHVGQRWGRMHKGMDIARPSNRAILAADNGVVVETGRDGGFGNKVVINHNNGMKTIYAHLSSIQVSPGQTVERGSKIGVMGTTGNSTGVHLHFEVHVNGSLKKPSDFF